MGKLVFADGERIGVYDGERVRYFESESIARYRDYAGTRVKNDEWKYAGDGARFRGDYELYRARTENVAATVNSVQFDGNKVVYSFTVDGSSGVYRKDVTDEKAREEHIFSSADEEILSLSRAGRQLAATVRRNGATSSIALLNMETSELKTLTEGDSRDANPCVSPLDPDLIYFDSAGIGLTASGEFTGKYAPSAICAFRLSTEEITEAETAGKESLIKPKFAPNGDLYCIQRPNRERGGNVFYDILLFPFRILKGIFGFLQAFVAVFGHTSLTSGTVGGDNPTRERKDDARKIYVDGKLIEADREMKRNRRAKDGEHGFIPLSWQLVKISGGKRETIARGICDYALADGGVYCTDGTHIFFVKDGKKTKIADTKRCLCVAAQSDAPDLSEVFSL